MADDSSNTEGKQKDGKSKGIDITKLLGPRTNVSTSIGTLYLYAMLRPDYERVEELADIEPMSRIRAFIPCIASTVDANGFKEKRESPSEETISRLSDEEIETISESYLKAMSLSVEKAATSDRPRRNQNESAISFLDRLLKHLADVNRTQSKSSIFDSVRQSSIQLGSTLNAFERLAKGPSPTEIHTADMSPLRGVHEQLALQRREREEELEMVRLTGQMTAESARTLKDLAEAATTLLLQLDEREKKADESTRTQILIAVWSVGISAVLSFVALVVALFGFFQDQSNNKSGDQWQTEMLDAIRGGNKREINVEKQIHHIQDQLSDTKTSFQHKESSNDKAAYNKRNRR